MNLLKKIGVGRTILAIVIGLVIGVVGVGISGTVTKPFTFSNNTVAKAPEVNADFDTLYTVVNGNLGKANIEADGVGDSEIDWGTGSTQVSADDMPIADQYGYYPTNTVESALDEISQGTRAVSWQISRGAAFVLNLAHSALTASRTWTFQDATDTVVGRATTDTMTNKSMTSPTITGTPTAASATWANLGSVTTVDVNGGTIGSVILDGYATGYTGVNISMYSDSGVTLKAKLAGNNGASILALTHSGQITNCAMSVTGSTLSVHGYDGSALAANNPCVVSVRSNSVGRVYPAYFTANVTATFGAASDTDGNLFGITNADWANALPMFVGVVFDGTTPYFTLSRLPLVQTGAATTTLCQKGDTTCEAQEDVMILATGLTLANFTNMPITQIGWFDATYATSGGAWTFSPTPKNGFNDGYLVENYTIPAAQLGAATGAYILANGGTAPIFLNNFVRYSFPAPGFILVQWNMNGDTATDGSGAVETRLVVPFVNVNSQTTACGNGYITNQTIAASLSTSFNITASAAYVTISEDTNTDISQNADFNNGAKAINGYCQYRAF